ncbi:GNAT family N-acetyltransferase [Arthrobacter jiangjiafuii]|uniref:GNAT family N-acetyltransferase n=1 Tax=Arthrobacter jiangjiafuii TaxID=2817475 RepID=A0A975R0T9_9MICC|nr:GNAT family N-acetyltransferase [Arthrobacter jiangjiafuii]MBP3044315.1 GNAT family N-acetyltransferase [Arthrobacter jiangjiafuii]QWC11270.1 GNAT family N-acetyltransferase [Arthrobacter jiangjiafuii]
MTISMPPEIPGPATGLRWRAISAEDVDAWLELVRRIAAVDKPGYVQQRADLEHVLAASSDNPARDTLLGLDRNGVPRAYGYLVRTEGSDKIHGAGGVDPQWRRRGIGTAMLRWQQQRARERLLETGHEKGLLRFMAEEDNASHVALFHAAGGKVVRYFTEMSRPLDAGIADVPLPEGLEYVTFHEDISEALRVAHNEVFRDHWGSEERDSERWQHNVEHPHFRADWTFVVMDTAAGEIAGYNIASFDPEAKNLTGYTEGYTELLGVRRNWRGLGLAPAMLGEAMRRYKASGMERAGLGVDTENPSGALGLYERLGYEPTFREVFFDFHVLP